MFGFFKPRPTLPPLSFHNTLSNKLERFEPLSKNEVRVYNCGPTAYDEQHIGNLFPPVIANVLRRTLEAWGYRVREVNNITDFGHISEDAASEDKMTKGMRKEHLEPSLTNMRVVAEKYAKLFWADLPLLGINPKTIQYPFASDYITQQIGVVAALEEKGYAYKTSDGVYFDVAKFPAYGTLGGINLSGQQAGARVEENKEKRGPHDFALWKLDAKFGWESPWGLGFPGWHTECVAMIFALLGKQIDIHMGGVDLIPTHHNNEIAQAEALTSKPFARYWIHNAHITIEGKKISKSLGNTIYLHNITDRELNPRSLRYWFLTAHYRTQANFTWDALEAADTALKRLTRTYWELPKLGKVSTVFMTDFYTKLGNDLDTPGALALMWNLLKDERISPADKKATLQKIDSILGLGFSETQHHHKLNVVSEAELPEEVQKLAKEREEVRKNKDFEKSDALRKQLEDMGYTVKDSPDGQKIFKS